MDFIIPTREQFTYGARALKTLAVVDGPIGPEESALLEAAQASFGHKVAVADIEAITPAELATALGSEPLGLQLLGGLVVMAMCDGDVDEREAQLFASFADALGVEDAAVANLKRIANRQLRSARLDVLRRQWAPRKIREMARRDGVGVYFKAVTGLLGVRDDPESIMRYQALGELPADSLGRAYFDYMMENEFSFPGERGAPPEAMLFHDLTHILSGYGTTAEDEILVASFSAGYSTEEVLNWLVFVLSQFQLGHQMAPNVPPEKLTLNPKRMLAAIRRGATMNIDINNGWDPWPVLGEPVEELRTRYDIRPESDFL